MHASRKLETFEPLGLFDDLFEEAKLPVTMLTRAQLDRRRASPALGRALNCAPIGRNAPAFRAGQRNTDAHRSYLRSKSKSLSASRW